MYFERGETRKMWKVLQMLEEIIVRIEQNAEIAFWLNQATYFHLEYASHN